MLGPEIDMVSLAAVKDRPTLMMAQKTRPVGRIATLLVLVSLCGHVSGALAQNDLHPLAPPDLSSPRSTLVDFQTLMNTAYFHWKTEGRSFHNRTQRATISHLAHQFF